MRPMENSGGFGIIGVMIAAALVAVAAMMVASFFERQASQGTRLELAGSCEVIASSVVEYLKKDEASLFISSYGPQPGTTRYQPGLDTTDDGLDRFRFGAVSAPQFMGPSGFRMSLASGSQKLPPNWKYFNHLNIKNSSNRLLILASNENICCESLNMNDPNCGSRFLDNNLSRPGFRLERRDVEVDIAVNFPTSSGGSLCQGARRLSLADSTIPDSLYREVVDFRVKVKVGVGGPNEQTCLAHGHAQVSPDSSPSLTLIELQNQDVMCAPGKQGLPSHCNAGSSVAIKVKTVKSTTGNACLANCMGAVQSQTCNSLNSLNLFNTFSHASCVDSCTETEPGSAFLCRIGEKNWFDNPMNANVWEPCELTRVYDFDGSIAGSVSIAYLPQFGNDRTEMTTNATITLSGLRENRAYSVDVRAVDTQGNVGASFCNSSLASCSPSAQPHFVVLSASPTVGELTETTNRVTTVSTPTQRGRNNTVTSQAKYANVLDLFGSNFYQCEAGTLSYTVALSSPVPPGAYGFSTSFCMGVLSVPGGGTVNIPSAAGSPGCLCSNTGCTAQLPVASASGPYEFQMTVQNDCSAGGETKTRNWCADNNVVIGANHGGNRAFGTSPDFQGHITYPSVSQKACGRVTLCPTLAGGYVPTLGSCTNATLGWNAMLESGCLQDPAGNHCALVIDPCGRYQNVGPTAYSTTLLGVPHTGVPANNLCFSNGGNQVGGNICSPGSYCSDTGKCFTSCETPPCPTNVSTPSSTNCGRKFCPALNSCTISIGSPPASGPACVGVPLCLQTVGFPYSSAGVPGPNCVDAPRADACVGICDPTTFSTVQPYGGCANAACICQCR